MTEIGQEYYRHCVAMLVEADAAQEVIERSRSEPQGIVRVSCPPALLCFFWVRGSQVHGGQPARCGAPRKHEPPR